MQYINADIRELGSFEEATNGFSFFGLYRDLFFGRTNVIVHAGYYPLSLRLRRCLTFEAQAL